MRQGPLHQATVKVFISYSRIDIAFAQKLVGALKASGFEAYLDKMDIAPAEPWKKRLSQLIRASDTVVFVISPDAVVSETCLWEVDEALRLSKRIVPVLWRPTDATKVPARLSELNWIFFNAGFFWKQRSFHTSLKQLISALQIDISWIREHTRYGELARTWQEGERAAHDILRGDTLVAAETWLTLRPKGTPEPSALLLSFIKGSRLKFDREEAEKKANIDRFLIAQSRFLADMSQQRREAGDSGTALLLALEALPDTTSGVERPYVASAELALDAALRSLQECIVIDTRPDEGKCAIFSPNGAVVAWFGMGIKAMCGVSYSTQMGLVC
jgi:hypothetical protein